MTEGVKEAQQRLDVGKYVELYTLDLTQVGGDVLYWSPSKPPESGAIIWQGNTYAQRPIKVEGIDRTATGPLPVPKITVGNIDNIVGMLVTNYEDLLGCTVSRTRTLYEFLDDQPDADPEGEWPRDVFEIGRKASEIPGVAVTFELAAAIDQQGAMIPRRVAVRDTCMLIYRRFDPESGEFVYTDATCPYVGDPSFNEQGVPCEPAQDACSKLVGNGCKARFGTNPLPFGGFPGMARVRTR